MASTLSSVLICLVIFGWIPSAVASNIIKITIAERGVHDEASTVQVTITKSYTQLTTITSPKPTTLAHGRAVSQLDILCMKDYDGPPFHQTQTPLRVQTAVQSVAHEEESERETKDYPIVERSDDVNVVHDGEFPGFPPYAPTNDRPQPSPSTPGKEFIDTLPQARSAAEHSTTCIRFINPTSGPTSICVETALSFTQPTDSAFWPWSSQDPISFKAENTLKTSPSRTLSARHHHHDKGCTHLSGSYLR